MARDAFFCLPRRVLDVPAGTVRRTAKRTEIEQRGLSAPRRSAAGRVLVAAVWLALIAFAPASAAPVVPRAISPVRAAEPGTIVDSGDGFGPREFLRIHRDLPVELLRTAPEAAVRVPAWPVAPGRREDVVLSRHEIYAPDARILRADANGLTEVPRSRLIFFWGEVAGDPRTRVLVTLDPQRGSVEGFSRSGAGVFELRRQADSNDLEMLGPPESALDPGTLPQWACGEEEFEGSPASAAAAVSAQSAQALAAPITSLHTATIAVDTDNELMQQKFSNNTTSASDYLASLFAAMNVMYERDLLVRLLQGTTYLRVSTAADPYAQNSNSNASPSELSEFSNYWAAHYGAVPRGLAMLLSGKQPSSSSASGIAWLTGLCNSSYGYSFSKVFKINYLSGDASVVGHEIGHNFGSPHTHCYSPPIDTCYASEGGCYSGPTSCPAVDANGIRGYMMSYCHLLGGCSVAMQFHTRTKTLLAPLIGNAAGVCIFPYVAPVLDVTAVSPSFGPTVGGTLTTITGANFLPGATVSFGGTSGTGVNVASPTRITVTAPAHAAGFVSVSVTNPDDTNGSLASAFDYQNGTGFYTIAPCRVLDTRNANGPLGGPSVPADSDRDFSVTGHCGIPSGAKAISVNLTVTGPTASGDVKIFPADSSLPTATTINYQAGDTRANNATIAIGPTGAFTVHCDQASGDVDILVDVNGYYQ